MLTGEPHVFNCGDALALIIKDCISEPVAEKLRRVFGQADVIIHMESGNAAPADSWLGDQERQPLLLTAL